MIKILIEDLLVVDHRTPSPGKASREIHPLESSPPAGNFGSFWAAMVLLWVYHFLDLRETKNIFREQALPDLRPFLASRP